MSVTIAPLTPDLWPAFEDLFGKQGACFGCWCTYFRLPPAARGDSDGERNRELIKARVDAGPPPGLLSFEEGIATGWMQIGPRGDVPEWNNARRASAPLDAAHATDPAIWAISCFFIRSKARCQGLTHKLVAGGIDFARENKARFIEACPMDLSKDARSLGLFVGSTRVFHQAGFETVVTRKAGRPLVRYVL